MVRAKKHTVKKAYALQIIRGILIVLVVTGVGYGIWHVTRLPSLTITEILVSGGETISPEVIQDEVELELEGTYVALIPRRFTYLYPAAAIENAVSAIPRVKDVILERPKRTTLTVTFTEYEPSALWCDEARQHCLFIDEFGYAFTDAPQLSGGSFLRLVVEDTPLLLRQTPLSEHELEAARTMAAALEREHGFVVEEVFFEQSGDVTYTLIGGAQLHTTAATSISETLSNLATVLESEDFLHLRPSNFAYIDLRFGNKVFVNEEVAGPVSTSTATSS